MRTKLFNLSRRLYRALNVLHLKWALRSVNRRLAALDAAWNDSSDLSYAMRRVDVHPAWLERKRGAMRIEHRRLAGLRKQIRDELVSLGVSA